MDTSNVTRVEVINHYVDLDDPGRGRVFTFWEDDAKIQLLLQDNGRTLKIWIDSKD